jgi:hypothetical protein
MYVFDDIDAMKLFHPGPSVPVSASIFGIDYPTDEDYSVFVWDPYSTVTDSNDAVKPTIDPTDAGRWIKIDIDHPAQVNSDWNAGSGVSQIQNKPTLATVATSGSYTDLSSKPTIPSVVTLSAPNTRSLALATAYQATDNTKAAIVTVTLTSTASITLTTGTTISGEIRMGSTTAVATGTGTAVAGYTNSITGTLVVGANISTASNQVITFALPAGQYFAVRQTAGSGLSIVSAFDQTITI